MSARSVASPSSSTLAVIEQQTGGVVPGCLHELVTAQAERTPEAVAVMDGAGASWTYRELVERARRLSHTLRNLGVGPEARAGVCLERGPEMVMALLAVLEAGGVYVPLDPGYPAERLAFMLEDSGAKVVITHRAALARPGVAEALNRSGCQALELEAWAEPEAEGLSPVAGPGNLAYLIYTSGSTGKPKGVAIEHRSAVQLLAWARQVFPPAELAGVLAVTSICFDLSVFEIFLPLSAGGRVVVVDNALALGQLPEPVRSAVTLVNTVPSAMAELVRAGALPASARTVCLAGEPLKGALAEAIYGTGAVERLFNLYGPSEDTTYSTAALIPRKTGREPSIGHPITGTSAHVLDADLLLVPEGTAGELFLGGAGLARGYLGRPDLTAERFVPDPFATTPGERLYRTGDRVRLRDDGELEFLGRLDHQVKVRGFRIELGEVEAALARHPAVRDTAVVVWTDTAGERHLVGYVEAGQPAPGVEELRAWLAERLPGYMVPTLFQVLPVLPRTPNLKIDRRALPDPERSTGPGRAAATPFERFLAETVGRLLDGDEVPVDADLLTLGAHSLLMAQTVTRVRQELGLELKLADVFAARTIEALARLLEARRGDQRGSQVPPVRRVPRDGELPLSFAQERIWFLEQLAPGNLAYNFQFSLRFRGPFAPRVLEAACAEVIRRHEIFRTTFPSVDGRATQVIHPPFPVRIPLVDLRGVSTDPLRTEAEAERRIAEALQVPYDITRLPLVRWTLFRLSDEDHVLLHVEHHFVHDGWSIGLVQDEIRAAYRAYSEGRTAPSLPEPEIQYADYAVWQREWLRGEVLESQLDFWARRLEGSPPVLELPADRPRPEAHSFRGGAFFFLVPPDLYGELRAWSRREGGSLFITMLAGFDTLLHRVTGQDDIVLGTGIANRRLRELEPVIGMMVNTVVMRNDLSGRPTFRRLVELTRERMLDLHEHQDLPFEHLVARLRPERHLDQNPLYQVMFSFHDAPMPELSFGAPGSGLHTELRYRHNRSAKADLNFIGIPHAEQRHGRPPGTLPPEMLFVWEFSADLFDRTTAQRLWDAYMAVLRGAVAAPALHLDEISLLGEAERHQLLREWNDTPSPSPAALLHGLFESRAERQPGATALVLGDRRLTYADLDDQANHLATRLRALGIAPDDRVGLFLERSLDMVVALLGILKSGGAYVPLDPMYPAERLSFLITDSRMRALVTDAHLASNLPPHNLPVLLTGPGAGVGLSDGAGAGDWTRGGLGRGNAPEGAEHGSIGQPHAGSLAYVIYTSGSTGRPKGVQIEHRSAVNVILSAIRDFDLGPASRVLQLASISFDASVLEIFTALGSGGTLYLVDHDTRLSPHRIEELIRAQDVSVIISPPSLLDTLAGEALPSLSTVIVGGEATSAETLRRWSPGRAFFNCYAPTETTIYSTFRRCDPDDAHRAPTMGRPIDGTRVHLLDRRLREVPLGATGELYVGGAGLARGYLGRPELTAERFVPDPLSEVPGARLYRTGDLARHLADGGLDFAGRFDQQVKIRGVRIELGEIEAAALQHPAVREAVVVVDRATASDPRLVAYVVPEPGAAPATAELRDFLQAKLPASLVPAAVAVLDALPITVHGKVDLAALPSLTPAAGQPATGFTPPAGSVEEMLAEIWGDVLGIECADRIGALDNFFELGGHSLLATRVMARIQDAFGVRLPVRLLFESPTVRRLAAAVERAKGVAGPPPPPLERVPREEALPLSFAQQRMWFLDQLEPGNPAYNVSFAWRLHGRFSVETLAAALTGMAARHEALRTVFPAAAPGAGGTPVQRVLEPASVPVDLVDLSEIPALAAEEAARHRAVAEAARPFDLATGPLLRAVVLRLAPEEHVVLVLSHHIVLDGSAQLFLRELGDAYRTAEEGEDAEEGEAPPPPLPFQYADFAHWQRRWLTGEVLETQRAYWTERLGGELPRLQLPTDRPRPAVRGTRGDGLAFTLGGGLGDGTRTLARQHGATLFMTLLAAFDVLLHRYTGQDDVCVGFPIADRPHAGLEGLIGCFVNTLTLRAAPAADLPFSGLLRRVREATLDAYAHKDLPFELLVESLDLPRDLSHTPVFQVMFVAHATPPPRLALPAAEAVPYPLESGGARFDWLLLLRPDGGSLRGQIEYAADLFDRTTIHRLTGHLERLLAAVVADPEARLGELPLLGAGERHQLLAEWNDTARPYDGDRLVHQWMEEQAARDPGAPAVIDDAGTWSYRELDERANRIAHQLRALGVGRGSAVGVHLERSAEMVAALLAVLKAGGTYVPLDEALPAERLRFVLGRLGARHLVTGRTLRDRLADLGGLGDLGVLALDDPEDAAAIAARPAHGLPAVSTPDDPAYVIFTSGSTGAPKGVTVRHRAVSNLIEWINRDFGVGPDDRVLFLTAIGFDLSVYDVFGLLAAGGSVRVASQKDVRDPERLLSILLSEPVTFWDSAPAALQQLAPLLPAAPMGNPALRRVFLSGDWIPLTLPERVRAAFPAARVVSLGGATEATVWSNVFPVESLAPSWVSVPYGRPMPNARYHVLDAGFAPCPVGVPGDLYIGGDCLAMGYAAEPVLTAERFVPDPFDADGGRLYWTGDRARRFADGVLEFLGRSDQQVKVRGFRVELGEIEAVLARHPGVREAVVVSYGETGEKSLTAYVVPRGEAVPPAALREHLAAHLPEYMVLAAFVSLAALPLTANGKLDRKALPRPDRAALLLTQEAVAPRTPAEAVLARLWSEVLGTSPIGVTDDFFDLGGHSLLATQLASRIREAFGIDLPLRAFFESPTIEALARRVDAAGGAPKPEGAALPPLVPRPRDAGDPPLSFAQQRLWFLDQLEPGSAVYDMPFGLRLRGRLDAAALESALAEIIRRHETLRTVFPNDKGKPRQEIRTAGEVALPRTDLRGRPAEEREAAARALASSFGVHPFDLAAGPLARFALLELAADEHLLLVNLHHIVSDGWSIGVFLGELGALYESFAAGQASPLPELPVQYADFAVWQRGWLRDAVLEAQLAYWRERLAGMPPVLALPLDRPRPSTPGYRGGLRALRLPVAAGEELRRLSRGAGATLFMALLAAFQTLLARVGGQADVPVGSPIANRRVAGVEGLIGFFVNTLVLRGDLTGGTSFRELLATTRESALGAYAHQDVPFEQLVEMLEPERDLGHSPLFQVLFALQSEPWQTLRPAGLEIALEPVESGLSKFDLSLVLTEEEAGLAGSLTYKSELFDAATVERLARRFVRLAEAVAADPDRPLSRLPLLGAGEEAQLLREWNDTARPGEAPRLAPELLAAHAAATPEAVAVRLGNERLTFAELDERAGRLARRLQALGVGAETAVGLHLDRVLDLLPAILGIWKAGGAFVPLPTDNPPQRLAFILEDAAVPVVVTRGELAANLPAMAAVVVDVEGIEDEGERLAEPEEADALAYILYTSGSTGRPKGTLVSHGGLAHYLAFCRDAYPLDGGAPVYTSLGFDLTLTSLLAPLSAGRGITLLAEDHAVETLMAAMSAAESPWGFVKLTPAHLELLNHALPPDALAGRAGALILGGEALRFEKLAAWRANAPATRLINEYGPTEAVVGCSVYEVGPDDPAAGPVPIGRPITGTRLHVLDGELGLVPAGSPGELCVGGPGLARGYLGRPGLTAERFVPDPFAETPGARLYRTGDLARYRADGLLEFLGRRDEQVKIRGFRIELGEIEAVLAAHPAVRDAVAMVREDQGEKRLAAYVVAAPDAVIDPRELREHLRRHLPDSMIPAFLAELEGLPLNVHGKVDRAALAALALPEEPAVPVWEEGGEAPRTPYEELVAGAFAAVLGRERVGPDDDFFDLGGHSLLATQVLSRLRGAVGVDLPLREIFERSTVADLAARVAEVHRAMEPGAVAEPPLAPAAPAAPGSEAQRLRAPLSFAQERLWIVDRLEPGNPTYNVPAALRLRGRLHADALRRALGGVVERHAALRTSFALADGQPVQIVAAPAGWALPAIDLAGLDAARREAESRRLAEAEARRPFDLTRGPLLRTLLLRLQGDEHVLVLNMHHIVSDGWSVNIFYRELAALYEAALGGDAPVLPPLPVQYTDFARWQRRWAAERGFEAQLGYWRRQLEGGAAFLDLPADRPRPAVQTHGGGRVVRTIPAALCGRLRELAREADATFFMVLLTGFKALLRRWAGHGDLAVGTPVANRNRTEVEGLIGFFVNTLVLRTVAPAGIPFSGLLERVRGVALGAYSHQDLPFEHLVDVLAPQRDLRYSPLFQVMFSYQESTVVSRQLRDLVLGSLEVDPRTAKFDLTLLLHQSERGLRAIFEFNADLFDGDTVARLAGHLENLLAGAVAAPATPMEELPLLTAGEREQLLGEWSGAARTGEAPRLAPDLLRAHAAATPEATAVRQGGEQLTFAELDERAGRLARHLRSLGVGPETAVGLYLDRGLDLLPAIFGIWQAGGAYVPLPTDNPPQRLAYILEDAAVPVVVTRRELAASLPASDAVVLDLDAVPAAPSEEIGEGVGADALAYILYTSGSTGRPKGTLVSHAGLAHYLAFCREAYPLDGGSPVYTSLGFDLTLTSLLAPLSAGRGITLLPEDSAVETLVAAMDTASPWGFVKLTPAHLELLNHALPPESLAGRAGALILGGEALRFEKLAAWRAHAPATRLINEYGPTEAVVGCSVYEVGPDDLEAGPVPIGRPITGTRLYVLDEALGLVPAGSPGELCVAGPGLARGYLGRPDLTAERFVPDPFAETPGGRLYRTGDLARHHRLDGVLEFLGRRDEQVKVRGFRIEPGEIEAVLRRHAGVRDAVVVVRDDLPGGRGLAAYWMPAVAAGEPAPAAEELRRFLAGELPEPMLPAAFPRLAELPLNRHGKVDHRALPAPAREEGMASAPAAAPAAAWTAPESELEKILAAVVGEILHLSRVGRDESFFDLGAHSLALVRMHERLSELGITGLTVLDLFRRPTVRSLADHLAGNAAAPAESGADGLSRADSRLAARDARQRSRERRQTSRS